MFIFFTLGCASHGYARLRLVNGRSAAPRYMVASAAPRYGCARLRLAIWLRSAAPRYMVALGGASLYGCARLRLAKWLRSAAPR